MDMELWKSLPPLITLKKQSTGSFTVPVERDHKFLKGMYSLYAVAIYYECIYEAALSEFYLSKVVYDPITNEL